MTVANAMRNLGEELSDVKVVEKILRSLTENFNYVVCTIEESKDIDALSVDELQSSLLVHEQKLTRKTQDDHVLKTENDSSGGRGRSRPDFDKSKVECSKDWFTRLDEGFNHSVKLGNDLRLTVKGIGDIRLEIEGVIQVITKVYYVPELTSSLLSLGQLQEKGLTIVIKQGTFGKCYKIDEESDSQIWHKRLGHVNYKSIRTMQYRHLVEGLPQVAEQTKVCEVCNKGKTTARNYSKEE
ncbi:uncharacterized protein LOC143576934 [Bidens hawaiensis]|uniref:uncharacterized protein LOC143576934 n=1 Tax=Bidens hawaiensis TaxID=980011 RepID=UPI00404B7728